MVVVVGRDEALGSGTFYHFSTKMRKCLGLLHENLLANHYGYLVKGAFYQLNTKMRKCLGIRHEKSSANHYGYLRPGFNLELCSTFKQTDPISLSYRRLLVNALSLKDMGS